MNWVFNNNVSFEQKALRLFQEQAKNCIPYQKYLELLKIKPNSIKSLEEIIFLPISFFKSHSIITASAKPEIIFQSSGTTSKKSSQHLVVDKKIYEYSFRNGFKSFYGNIKDYRILCLLPNYLEQTNSSLIYMCNDLIKKSKNSQSGFYLDNLEELIDVLKEDSNTLLIGVSYALLDLAEHTSFNLSNTIIMETGGMKGRRKELVRSELHRILCNSFGVPKIHSEYGMTELLSQAYSKGDGIFHTPPWMKVLIRDIRDPFKLIEPNKTGGINIIDLANINSCAFIATEDLGKTYHDHSFEVLGRLDNSDLRGCNLLME